jgi:hypothetical protein
VCAPGAGCAVMRVRLPGLLVRGSCDPEEFSNVEFDFFTCRKKFPLSWV